LLHCQLGQNRCDGVERVGWVERNKRVSCAILYWWRRTSGTPTPEWSRSTTATWRREAIEKTLTYYRFPEEHWRRIRTNNPLDRILREIRRRTRVVGAFPDGQSALNLAAARLRHIAGTAWSSKRYLSIEPLKDQQMRGAITA
jgi:transposase-like protein